MRAKNLKKVTRVRGVMGRKRPLTLRELSYTFHHLNSFNEACCLNYANNYSYNNKHEWHKAEKNSVAFLEINLLAESPCASWKIGCFPKVKGVLLVKLGGISIRCLVYSQRLHCWFVAESFLVCQLKKGEVLGLKAALEYHKIATSSCS